MLRTESNGNHLCGMRIMRLIIRYVDVRLRVQHTMAQEATLNHLQWRIARRAMWRRTPYTRRSRSTGSELLTGSETTSAQ